MGTSMLTPNSVWYNHNAVLINADATSLANVGCSVRLAKNPAAFNRDRVAGDMDEATFDGYGVLNPDALPELVYEATRKQFLSRLVPPAGGWAFICNGVGGLPQTIYGYFVLNSMGALIGCEALPSPVLLTTPGQFITIPDVLVPYSKDSYEEDPIS
jgi:hypothetical protein